MSKSSRVKAMLEIAGKKQIELAEDFGISKQAMNNKMARDSWSGNDLARAAELVGWKLALVSPDGQKIFLDYEPKEEAPGE